MSSVHTQSLPLLATGANKLDPKETTMTMIQQPNTVVSPPPSKIPTNQPGNPNAEVIALSPKAIMTTNIFLCEVCNKGFKREQNLQLHRRVHDLPWKLNQNSEKEVRRKVYICPEPTCVHHDPSCALGDLTCIKKHYCRKHCEKKLKCEKCPKMYALQSDWKNHSGICGTKGYGCVCGSTFSRRYNYILHKTFCNALKHEPERNLTASFRKMGAVVGGSGGRHGFYGSASSSLGKRDSYGGAASIFSHDQFGNKLITGLTPPAADYTLNRSSSEKFEKPVPQPTNPNPGPTNFPMQFSSNQGLLAHDDQTLRSQRDLISFSDRINNDNNITNLGTGDFYASAISALGGHSFYGGAASALSNNQFSNSTNTDVTPPAADYNLNRSSWKMFEEFVSPPTNPNPVPTNFPMQFSSNQELLAHNDHTPRSQPFNQALFTHGGTNNDPPALLRGLPSSSSSLANVVANGFGQNQNGNLPDLMNCIPVTKNQQGWFGSNIFVPNMGNNHSMEGSNMLTFDFLVLRREF